MGEGKKEEESGDVLGWRDATEVGAEGRYVEPKNKMVGVSMTPWARRGAGV